MRGLAQRLSRDRSGIAAIEFALIAVPLFMTVFVIFECAVQTFVATSLDLAVQKSARQIRVGAAQGNGLGPRELKAAVCREVQDLFGCRHRLLMRIGVVSDLQTVSSARAVDGSGRLAVDETFDMGASGDFLLVEAFLPWPALVPLYTLASERTSDGEYVLRSSTLFRNEPF